jgi:hypothetical protein
LNDPFGCASSARLKRRLGSPPAAASDTPQPGRRRCSRHHRPPTGAAAAGADLGRCCAKQRGSGNETMRRASYRGPPSGARLAAPGRPQATMRADSRRLRPALWPSTRAGAPRRPVAVGLARQDIDLTRANDSVWRGWTPA